MPRDYNKSEEKSRRRERSRSRSRSHSRVKRDSIKERRERNKTSKWSDAPEESSRFSNAPPEKEIGSQFDSKNNINSLNSSLFTQQMQMPSKSKMNNNNPLNFLEDNSKLKRKIYIPKSSEINYVGLLIGPKGTYQKRLEQQTGCKILIRGKGTQKEGNPPQPDDNEEKHVLIIGDSEDKLIRAQNLIERVLFADEKTRNRIKEEQIKASQEIRSELLMQGGEIPHIEEYMLTPYGPPDKSARIVPVPNDCVGLIIGKNGETIRRLNRESGCKVQIAIKPIPNTDVRNVFIEGPPEKYEIAKKLIEEIVSEQITLKERNPFFQLNLLNNQAVNSSDPLVGQVNPFPGPHTPLRIPNKMVGLIIGRNGETVKNIHEKTKCFIFIPKESRPGEDFRELQLSGPPGSVENCKREIISMIHLALYGRLPYMNSLFYPFLDPVTGLPIIDPNTLSQLDPNTKINYDNMSQTLEGLDYGLNKLQNYDTIGAMGINNLNTSNMSNMNNMNNMNTGNPNMNFNPNVDPNFYGQPQQQQQPQQSQQPQQMQQLQTPNKSGFTYDLNDYDNPMNYDLYFQSLYQMYPHMNDYTKSANNQNPQYIISNNGLMDENRSLYDPNYIVSMFSQMVDGNGPREGEEINTNQEANANDRQSTFTSEADYNKYIDNMYNPRRK